MRCELHRIRKHIEADLVDLIIISPNRELLLKTIGMEKDALFFRIDLEYI